MVLLRRRDWDGGAGPDVEFPVPNGAIAGAAFVDEDSPVVDAPSPNEGPAVVVVVVTGAAVVAAALGAPKLNAGGAEVVGAAVVAVCACVVVAEVVV
jgi:hypothetical protein